MKKSFKLKFMIMRKVSSFLLVIAFIGTICNVHTFAGANQNEIVNKASVSDFTNGYKLSGKSLFTFIPHADFGDTSISHFNNALYQVECLSSDRSFWYESFAYKSSYRYYLSETR